MTITKTWTLMTILYKIFIAIKGWQKLSQKAILNLENPILQKSQETSNQRHRNEKSKNTHTTSERDSISKLRLKGLTIGIVT